MQAADAPTALEEIERWNTEIDSPFRPPHEIAELGGPDTGLEAYEAYESPAYPGEQEAAAARPTIRRGGRGPAVQQLQQALIRSGAQLTADGNFGPATEAAVRAFQSANALSADGVVGPSTWAKLEPQAAGAAMATIGSGGAPAPSGGVPADVPTEPRGTLRLEAPGRSFSYPFTREDLIWTAKLIVYEAGGRDDEESAAVLWAMFNHYAFFRHVQYPSFTRFIRAYSTTLQPVLNSWRAAQRHYQNPSSRFVRMSGFYKDAPHIPRGQLQRHLDIQRAPWSSISPTARGLAIRALRGELPNPGIGNANEFVSTRILYYHAQNPKRWPTPEQWRAFTQQFKRTKLRWIGDVPNLDQTKNAFFVTRTIADVPAGAVRIDPPGAGATREAYEDGFEATDAIGQEAFEDSEDRLERLEEDLADTEEGEDETFFEAFEPQEAFDPTGEEYASAPIESFSSWETPATGEAVTDQLEDLEEPEFEELDAFEPMSEAEAGTPINEESDVGPTLRTLDELVTLETGAGSGLADRLRAVAAFTLGPTLRRGANGPAVAALQRSLISLGHDLAVDGDFGPNTDRAVRAFQTGAGLGADGIVGTDTKAAIATALARGGAAPAAPIPVAAAALPTPGPAGGTVAIPVPPACVHVPALGADRDCLSVDPTNFAGDAAIATFAQGLAACATSRVADLRARGQAVSERAQNLADVSWLTLDFAATVRATASRATRNRRPCSFNATARGWMFGRREELDFVTIGTGRGVRLAPPARPAGGDQLVAIAPQGRGTPVQPYMKRFLDALAARHRGHSASNYAGHGGGDFNGRGYSVDLWLRGTDDRGFYHRPQAVALIQAVAQAAAAIGAEWRILYNDFAVAAAINRPAGIRRVAFVGSVRPPGTNLNWHGPLLLHMHLDIAPR